LVRNTSAAESAGENIKVSSKLQIVGFSVA